MSATPPKKKAKTDKTNNGTTGAQSNLLNYFGSTKPKQQKDRNDGDSKPAAADLTNATKNNNSVATATNTAAAAAADKAISTDPIVPHAVPCPSDVSWQSLHDNLVIVRKPKRQSARTKVAAFDMDGTLLCWASTFKGMYPNQFIHYELWSSKVPTKLRALHDEGYKVVIITNQGGIQKAHQGKKATHVKGLVDWIAYMVDRPLFAVMSTRSPKKSPQESFHKPSPKMWQVVIDALNDGVAFDLAQSFFVGDSADLSDEQGGVDLKFAENVGFEHSDEGVLRFHTPTEYFGPSDGDRRQRPQATEQLPQEAIEARAALLGGYLSGPILLILCGVQGSGKSTFCEQLLIQQGDRNNKKGWKHFSQDTINNGKPGKREKVEKLALEALLDGHPVVVDRMHLDPTQREYFVQVAKEANVPAHVVLLIPPRNVISQRVRDRTNHPGKVQGEDGAKRALKSLDGLVFPTYDEKVQLINCASTNEAAMRLSKLYGLLAGGLLKSSDIPESISFMDGAVKLPMITLGTMGIGKKKCKEVLPAVLKAAKIKAIDTAPTYRNEEVIGEVLSGLDERNDLFYIAKVSKTAIQQQQIREFLQDSLQKLQRSYVDLLLLHWPCDAIDSGKLGTFWAEMEQCQKDGLCKALGVCNFNEHALDLLLQEATILPIVNQVERHPLLPQMSLIDYCARNNIQVQAHTTFGQGRSDLLEHATIQKVAKETNLSPAQIILQWNLQHGIPIVGRCTLVEHAQEWQDSRKNVILSSTQMKELDTMESGKRFVAPPFMFGSASYCWPPPPSSSSAVAAATKTKKSNNNNNKRKQE